MSLHNEIMNIPVRKDVDYSTFESKVIAYKTGHRDARHQAAEISVAYEQRIEELEKALRELITENDLYMPDETKQWYYSAMRKECLKLLGIEQ